MKEKEEARKGLFKKGVTAEDARKKRTDLSNQIRKEKKETRIAKKRQVLLWFVYYINSKLINQKSHK